MKLLAARTTIEQCDVKRMKYYATLLHNCLLAQGSSCGKMSNALSLMELPATGGGVGVRLPGPVSERNPALDKLALFDLGS